MPVFIYHNRGFLLHMDIRWKSVQLNTTQMNKLIVLMLLVVLVCYVTATNETISSGREISSTISSRRYISPKNTWWTTPTTPTTGTTTITFVPPGEFS